MGNQAIMAWLVCTGGANKGKYYRLTGAVNGIGTDENMTVVIDDDNVKKQNHATINFDDRCRKFYISPNCGKRIIRLNGNVLFGAIYMKAYDKIEIGNNEFLYIPYACSPDTEKPASYGKRKDYVPCVDILTEMADCKESPIVGWLVCTEGEHAGEDFAIKSDFNYVGKGPEADIDISWDDNMPEGKQVAMVYDCKDNRFYIQPVNSVNVFVSGQPLQGFMPLRGFEEVFIGGTRFIFVPFCGDNFRWEIKEEKTKMKIFN